MKQTIYDLILAATGFLATIAAIAFLEAFR